MFHRGDAIVLGIEADAGPPMSYLLPPVSHHEQPLTRTRTHCWKQSLSPPSPCDIIPLGGDSCTRLSSLRVYLVLKNIFESILDHCPIKSPKSDFWEKVSTSDTQEKQK